MDKHITKCSSGRAKASRLLQKSAKVAPLSMALYEKKKNGKNKRRR
ncbi:MAG: hypothetical protein L3J70_08190 [Gammaproteobacteria bacterium]|nr:hypothetical protein [Gammaproteobacteria bacterium]